MFTKSFSVAVVVASIAATAVQADDKNEVITGSIRSGIEQSSNNDVSIESRQNYPQVANLGGGFIEMLFSDKSDEAVDGQNSGQSSVYSPQLRTRHGRASQNQDAYQVPSPYVAYQNYADEPRPADIQIDPRFEPQMVEYKGRYSPGTVIINTNERFLYYVMSDGQAMRYGVGVGRPGFEWRGEHRVSRKAEWPAWTPPPEMLKRRPDLPRHMSGGPLNPLGARAMYLGSSIYRIHGSNEPETIGQAVSSGCIRMRNEDVIDLYKRVNVGARVVVL